MDIINKNAHYQHSKPLCLLYIEDTTNDLVSLLEELQDNYDKLETKAIKTDLELKTALLEKKWDLIISDYHLSTFKNKNAINLIKSMEVAVPFIIVSRNDTDNIAIEAIKAGAYDYILQDDLIRLVPIIKRELKYSETKHYKKIAEDQLLHDAFYDSLTELPNRSIFMDRLNQSISRTKRKADNFFAVIFLDIDRFKIINEGLGHKYGDVLLKEFAKKIQTCLREGDTVTHFGGDEFVLLIDAAVDMSSVVRVMMRIKDELLTPFILNGHEIFTTVSAGITSSEKNYERAEDVLRDADIAMHRAKTLGRSRYEFFDKHMHTQMLSQLKLESDLRRALDRDECEVFYQPIMSLKTQKIESFEALMRWRHNFHLYQPVSFLPLAEETGLIVPLERWLILESCKQLKKWHDEFEEHQNLTININFSSKQFWSPDLIPYLNFVLKESGIQPQHLFLEITEGVIMKDVNEGIKILNNMKNAGVLLCIDDFGTGYSSLSYLLQLPIDYLKIDKSFINKITINKKHNDIVKTIIDISKNLDIQVVAEGIELEEQLKTVQHMKCEFGQGFLFAKPISKDKATLFLKNSDNIHYKDKNVSVCQESSSN